MRWAYYNENDGFAAEWLRNLIREGHIAPGEVDARDIREVRGDDLRGFQQCHFFAGVGVWSYALRRANWFDDRPVWTGSCPCQPYSAAGKKQGDADARHLWPSWFRLIRECRPAIVFGEQVASKDALRWFDAVSDDLEGEDYAVGAADLCAPGVGAPHIRQRLFWMADHHSGARGQGRAELSGRGDQGDALARSGLGSDGEPGRMADAHGGNPCAEWQQRSGEQRQQSEDGGASGLGNPQNHHGRLAEGCDRSGMHQPVGTGEVIRVGEPASRRHGANDLEPVTGRRECAVGSAGIEGTESDHRPGPLDGLWRDADWLKCTDGSWRPVEPGAFPLAHGVAGRVGRLRAYGNAIVAPLATEFIRAAREACHEVSDHE